MWRIAVILIGLALTTVGMAGDAKKPPEPIKDGYFKVTFEGKGVLKLTQNKETGKIIAVGLEGAGAYFLITLDDNKSLHEAARKLDGKMVIATGKGALALTSPPGGLSNGEFGMVWTITALRAADKRK